MSDYNSTMTDKYNCLIMIYIIFCGVADKQSATVRHGTSCIWREFEPPPPYPYLSLPIYWRKTGRKPGGSFLAECLGHKPRGEKHTHTDQDDRMRIRRPTLRGNELTWTKSGDYQTGWTNRWTEKKRHTH